MSSESIVVLVLDGESGQSLKAIRCLAEDARYQSHVVARTANAHVRLSRHVKSFNHFEKAKSEPEYIDYLLSLVKKHNVDIVFPILEDAVALLARNRSLFEDVCTLAPIPSASDFEIATDKRRLGLFMYENGIPAPRTFVYDPVSGRINNSTEIEYPVLAKPGRGGFGKNIHTLKSAEALASFFKRSEITPSDFAIQPFMDGTDIDCSVLCRNGKIVAHTIQRTIVHSRRSYGPPAGIEFVDNAEVYDIVQTLLSHLDWEGVAHVDLRCDSNGRHHVLEINARYWGSLLGSLAAGVNFPVLSCEQALGERTPQVQARKTRYGVGLLGFSSRRAQSRAGIPLRNTRFPHILHDPMPDVAETARVFRNNIKTKISSK